MTLNDSSEFRFDLTEPGHFDLIKAIDRTAQRHMLGEWRLSDGYISFELDTDVFLEPWSRVIETGVYNVQAGDDKPVRLRAFGRDGEGELVCEFCDHEPGPLDPEYEEHKRATRITFDVTNYVFDADRNRIDLSEGRQLQYFDLLLWLVIQDADNRGEKERADSYFRIVYDADRDAIIGEVNTGAESGGIKADVPKVDDIKPHRHYSPNAKTTQVLTKPVLFDGVATVDVGRKKGQLMIDFGLNWADGEPPASINTTQPIDKEDVRVIAAVVTLKRAGNTTVSPFQIAESIGYAMPTAELQAEIHERVMKLRQVDGRIDWTAQARYYGIVDPETGKPFERAEITGHLIDCTVFDATDVDGHRYIRYQLLSDPITYQHAHMLKQVIDYPQRLLSLKPISEGGDRKKRVTREQTQIIDSILWFVYSVKDPKNRISDSIRYETLFERAGIDVSHPKKRQRSVAFVNDYLRALQQDGIIRGYQVYAPGRSRKPLSFTVDAGIVSKRGRR